LEHIGIVGVVASEVKQSVKEFSTQMLIVGAVASRSNQ